MTTAIARQIIEASGLRRCKHAEDTTYCGCTEGRCEDRAARLRQFIKHGGWSDTPRIQAWAESMVSAGLLVYRPRLSIALPPNYDLTREGWKLVGSLR
jgi:hypothetical protein